MPLLEGQLSSGWGFQGGREPRRPADGAVVIAASAIIRPLVRMASVAADARGREVA